MSGRMRVTLRGQTGRKQSTVGGAKPDYLPDLASSYPAGRVAERAVGGGGVTPAMRITRWIASIVSAAGLKLPGRNPSAISSGVQPYLSLRFQMPIFAPRSASNCTIFGRLL